jgi:Cft2 family RNA processing exonuclease
MSPFELTCFGTGDGWPCADRNHSSFHYRFGRTSFIVDCGESVSRAFKASGWSYDSFEAILLSHLHCDHIGGFFMFMQGLWLEKRQKDLPIYLPEDGIKPLRDLLNAGMIFEELLAFSPNYIPLHAAKSFKVKDVKVTPYPTTHLESLRKSFQRKYTLDFAAYSFLFETAKLRIAHSADIGEPKDLDPLLAQPVDLLVCELAHFEPKDLFRYLKGRDIGRIVFMHVARQYREDQAGITKLAQRHLGDIPFTFATDGMQVQL